MLFTSGVSDLINAKRAAEQACRQVKRQLGASPCHMVCVFASTMYRTPWPEVLGYISEQLNPSVLIGCSGSGIIGGNREFEWVPALSIMAAHLPEVELYPFALTSDETSLSVPGSYWFNKIGVNPEQEPVFILMADPFTCNSRQLVMELNEAYPERPIVGGLISGGNSPGEHLVFIDGEVYREGAVGLAMTGNVSMDTIVSQGCRSIGKSYVITRCEDNVIWELGNRQAMEVLHEALQQLSSEDRELAQQGGIVIGLVVNEMRHQFSSGDFLIRNITGLDPSQGGIAVTDEVIVGQTLQFHLRDAGASHDELQRLLKKQSEVRLVSPPAGGLMFNCLGRGRSLYGTSHHDVKAIQMVNNNLPVGGVFCNGEIGPLGKHNFLHGYTASLGLFRPNH